MTAGKPQNSAFELLIYYRLSQLLNKGTHLETASALIIGVIKSIAKSFDKLNSPITNAIINEYCS